MLFIPENPMTPIAPAWFVIPRSSICLSAICLLMYSSPPMAFLMLLCSLAVCGTSGGNCIKISLPGKSILRSYFQENRTSRRPFLLLRISFPGRPIFIQFIPGPRVRQLDNLLPHRVWQRSAGDEHAPELVDPGVT